MTPRRILLAGWIVFLLFVYPGFMKVDGADLMMDARTGNFTDVHSPMTSQIWNLVNIVIAGPPGVLLLQSLMLLAGAYDLLCRLVSARAAAIGAVVLLLVPPVMMTAALVSPEAQLASFTLAGTALLLHDRLRDRLVGLVLLAIACATREGGELAVIPIVVALFRWSDAFVRWKRAGIAVLAALAVVVTSAAANRLLIDEPSKRRESTLALADIVGTIAHADDLTDDQVRALLPGVEFAKPAGLQAHARAIYGKPLLYAQGADPLLVEIESGGQRDALIAARGSIIRAEPGAYLAHRWWNFKRFLALAKYQRWSPFYADYLPSQNLQPIVAHTARHSLLQGTLLRSVRPLSRTFLFRPYFYFYLALVLVPLAVWRRQRLALVLLASGILYELSLMFVALRGEWRDSHWLVVTTVLATIVLVTRGARSRE